MPLGIEQNNLAPQLIQNSGAALVQGIRQIGQQISGHLTELQTKRDLGAMAQELQGLNVQSNEFPVQLTQMLSRHPLAARDERGQMALSILGKAHGQWQAGEAEARAFNRAMAMQGIRTRDARESAVLEEELRSQRPMNVPGVGLVQPNEIDEVTGQPKLLVPAVPRGGAAMPFVSTPSGILDKRTGAVTPAPAKTMNPYQSESLKMRKRAELRSVIKSKADTWSRDIRELEDSIRAVDKEELEQGENFRPARAVERLEWQKKLLATKELRDAALQEMSKIDSAPEEVEPELGPVPAGAATPAGVLPAPGEVAPAASNTEFVLVFDPSGKPGRVRASQLESALANGYRRR